MQGNFVAVILYIVRSGLNSQTKDNSSLYNLYAHIPYVQESGFYGRGRIGKGISAQASHRTVR